MGQKQNIVMLNVSMVGKMTALNQRDTHTLFDLYNEMCLDNESKLDKRLWHYIDRQDRREIH